MKGGRSPWGRRWLRSRQPLRRGRRASVVSPVARDPSPVGPAGRNPDPRRRSRVGIGIRRIGQGRRGRADHGRGCLPGEGGRRGRVDHGRRDVGRRRAVGHHRGDADPDAAAPVRAGLGERATGSKTAAAASGRNAAGRGAVPTAILLQGRDPHGGGDGGRDVAVSDGGRAASDRGAADAPPQRPPGRGPPGGGGGGRREKERHRSPGPHGSCGRCRHRQVRCQLDGFRNEL